MMITHLRHIILVLTLVSGIHASAQYTSEESNEKENPMSKLAFRDRLYYGGNFNIGGQNSFLFVDISPSVGYKITERYSVGVSTKFMHIGSRQFQQSFQALGGGLFTRYYVIPEFFLHGEYEALRLKQTYGGNVSTGFTNAALAGGGYVNDLGFGQLYISLLYDFIDHPNSLYQFNYLFGPAGPPIIYRFGFVIGF